MSEFPSFLRLNNIIFHYVDGPHFVYLFTYQWTLGRFHFPAVVTTTVINMGVQVSVQDPAYNSFGYILRSEISGSYSNSLTFGRPTSHHFCCLLFI